MRRKRVRSRHRFRPSRLGTVTDLGRGVKQYLNPPAIGPFGRAGARSSTAGV
jgi:hypothetical protein